MSDHPTGKAELAEWMGYETVEQMDAEHDDLHQELCAAFGLKSQSMAWRDGEDMTTEQYELANYEESAVLHVQRWLTMSRRGA